MWLLCFLLRQEAGVLLYLYFGVSSVGNTQRETPQTDHLLPVFTDALQPNTNRATAPMPGWLLPPASSFHVCEQKETTVIVVTVKEINTGLLLGIAFSPVPNKKRTFSDSLKQQ